LKRHDLLVAAWPTALLEPVAILAADDGTTAAPIGYIIAAAVDQRSCYPPLCNENSIYVFPEKELFPGSVHIISCGRIGNRHTDRGNI
jgi:hypothetical protein